MKKLVGVPVYHGIVVAPIHPVYDYKLQVVQSIIRPHKLESEYKRFLTAIEDCKKEIAVLIEQLAGVKNTKEDISEEILDVYLMLLDDQEFHGKVKDMIFKTQSNSEWAVKRIIQHYIHSLQNSHDEYFRDRVHDFNEIGIRVIQKLSNEDDAFLKIQLNKPSILCATNLFPSQLLRINLDNLKGIVLEEGGVTSHISIIAKAYGIPMLTGVKDILEHVEEHEVCVLDTHVGELFYQIEDAAIIDKFRQQAKREEEEHKVLTEKAKTTVHSSVEGVHISFQINVDVVEELKEKYIDISDGIGLFRSEFLLEQVFKHHDSEHKQFHIYKNLLERMGDKTVTIRTFDAGGDKLPVSVSQVNEENPLLGYRGIRFCLGDKDFFLCQLRALLRASMFGNLRILIPLVSCVEEIVLVRACLEKAKEQLDSKGHKYKDVPLGIMIEVPSVAYILPEISQYCDFFSVGTNDLLQYTMATDRGNPYVSDLYSYYQPSFLRVLNDIFFKVSLFKKDISLCGEMASYHKTIPLLMGMGLRAFSVTSSELTNTVLTATSLSIEKSRDLVEDVLQCSTVKEVEKKVEAFFAE